MRGKWHLLLVLAAVGCGAAAGYCQVRAEKLGEAAELEQQRSVSAGTSFVDTFSGEFVDAQLDQLDHRRLLLRASSHWRQGMLFSIVGTVLFAFAGYTLRTIETGLEEIHAHAGTPVPAPQRV